MQALFHPAEKQGCIDHGWLKTCHGLGFVDFYDPDRMGFGHFRVLDDDEIVPRKGFPMYARAHIKILSIRHGVTLEH